MRHSVDNVVPIVSAVVEAMAVSFGQISGKGNPTKGVSVIAAADPEIIPMSGSTTLLPFFSCHQARKERKSAHCGLVGIKRDAVMISGMVVAQEFPKIQSSLGRGV
jgi:hypothetical protein